MKVHLSQIGEGGWRTELDLPAASLARVVEALGEQDGRLVAEVALKHRGGNVEVGGALRITLRVPCQRCLDPVPVSLDEPLRITLTPDPGEGDLEEELHLSAGDLEVSFFSGEEIDVVQVLEDEIFLLLPEPVCGEDEAGQCLACGRNVEDMLRTEEPSPEGHPFAKLKDLLS